MRVLSMIVVTLAVVACDVGITGPQASRAAIASVRVGDILYVQSAELGADVAGAVVATVIRQIRCDGVTVGNMHISDVCLFEDGDSELLAAGTTLHAIEGQDPAARLSARHDEKWIVLTADPRYRPGQPF